ncbi:MAG: hypothetical protein ACR2I0_02145, partial [Rhodoferax sp.]
DLILMVPDFIDALETVRSDSRLATTLPFVDSGLDQILLFSQGFKDTVYDKIDFYKPRVDLLSFGSATVDSTGKLTNPFNTFDAKTMDGQQVSLYQIVNGSQVLLGTYDVGSVIDGKQIQLSGSPAAGAGLVAVVHAPRVQITTLQEFMLAVNASGVLPAGMQIVFDPVQRSFSVPLAFREEFTPLAMPLNFDFGSDAFTLSTSAQGSMTVFVAGSLSFFADLDGRTLSGKAGSVAAGNNLFSDSTFIFDSTMLGYTLELGGDKYTVVGMRDAHTVALDHAAAAAVSLQGYTLRQNSFQMGIENVSLSGGISMDVSDLEVGVQIGFLGATAGGAGTGSNVHLGATVAASLDRNPGSGNALDRRFNFDEVGGSALHFTLTGEAEATLRGLRVNAGVGSDIALAPNIEISMRAMDPFNIGALKVINQNPMYAANIDALVLAGTIKPTDLVIIMPDLGSAFNFKNLSFADIVDATRMGLELVKNSIADQPFYTVVLPIIGRSLSEAFPFVDGVLATVEDAANNPAPAISAVEAIFEDALGIKDDNTKAAQDQMFSLSLAGDVLNIHLQLGMLFEQKFGFSLDLAQLAAIAGPGALAGMDFVDSLADVVNPGASGNITMSAMAKLQVDAGIRFSGSSPEFFLYDYNPTRIETVAVAAFGTVAFTNRRSEVSEDAYAGILKDFRSVLSGLGAGVERVTAVVNAAYDAVKEAGNVDLANGADQLVGRRQAALVALASRLSSDLGVNVELYAGQQESLANPATQKAFDSVKV